MYKCRVSEINYSTTDVRWGWRKNADTEKVRKAQRRRQDRTLHTNAEHERYSRKISCKTVKHDVHLSHTFTHIHTGTAVSQAYAANNIHTTHTARWYSVYAGNRARIWATVVTLTVNRNDKVDNWYHNLIKTDRETFMDYWIMIIIILNLVFAYSKIYFYYFLKFLLGIKKYISSVVSSV